MQMLTIKLNIGDDTYFLLKNYIQIKLKLLKI